MRNYAQVTTSLWAPGSDFLALSARAQRLYMLLITQPNITAVGLLPLTLRRWASLAVDTTAAELEDILTELEDARYVVIDRESEELLVRSFVKWDNGYRNEKRRPLIVRSAAAVTSWPIRWAIAQEFEGLGLPTDGLPDGPPDKASRRASDAVSPSDGVVVTAVVEELPQPATHNPQPVTLGNAVAPTTTDALVAEWLEHCAKRPPRDVVGQVAKHTKALLAEGIDPSDVRRGLAEWHRKGLHPRTLSSVVNEVMNAPGNVVSIRASPDVATPAHWDRAMERARAKEGGSA